MNEFRRGDVCRFAGQIVTVAAQHQHISGERSYLIEFADGSYSRAREGALFLVGAEPEPSKGKLPSVTSVMVGFFRAPAKARRILK